MSKKKKTGKRVVLKPHDSNKKVVAKQVKEPFVLMEEEVTYLIKNVTSNIRCTIPMNKTDVEFLNPGESMEVSEKVFKFIQKKCPGWLAGYLVLDTETDLDELKFNWNALSDKQILNLLQRPVKQIQSIIKEKIDSEVTLSRIKIKATKPTITKTIEQRLQYLIDMAEKNAESPISRLKTMSES